MVANVLFATMTICARLASASVGWATIGGARALGGAIVAAFHHFERCFQLGGGHQAHADQFVQQGALLVVVALDDVVVLLVHQPNLPVM